MKKQNKKSKAIQKIIKSCLNELGLQLIEEVVEQDMVSIITGIKDDDISIYMELTFRSTSNLLNIKVSSPGLFDTECILAGCQITNLLNAQLMDIGHFSVNRDNGDVILQTSVNLSSQNYNRKQILSTIKRIMIQGYQNFRALHPMAEEDRCPLDAFPDYFIHNEENQDNEKKTIH
jgi:hypothetical protein